MKNITKSLTNATNWVVGKSSASVRLATGITGDAVACGVTLAGGTIAVAGGIVAAVGAGTFLAGTFVMRSAATLSEKSQAMADKAYEDLVGSSETREDEQHAEAPPADALPA